jgi:hypothetical protein
MKNMQVLNNFLDSDNFKNLQNLILNSDFPWRRRESMTDTDKNIYFTYSFFNENKINSDLYDHYIIPVLKKLNCNAVIQVRANMFLNKLFNKSGWHSDYNLDSKTAILYLNSCNGGTELKIEEEIKFIKSEENKLIIFPSKTIHRVCTSTNVDARYIININYF